jgi:tetratricopeptide (TPR) repeat protein
MIEEARMKPVLAFSALAIVLLAAPAFAAGGGSSPPNCPRGQVYDQRTRECVPQNSGVVDDQSLVTYAAALSGAERYREALDVLDLMQDPNTAVALNYRGYATRKLGRIDEGIDYYLQSVALDPEYTLVREYLGEAYVIQGKLDLAKQQLSEIEARCGTTCEPYGDLAEAIAAAEI